MALAPVVRVRRGTSATARAGPSQADLRPLYKADPCPLLIEYLVIGLFISDHDPLVRFTTRSPTIEA